MIVICHDWHHYLDEALKQLKKQTTETNIVVMTDGSSQETVDIAKKHGAIVSLEEAKNNIDRMNKAVERIVTPYYVFLGVDDFLVNYYVELAEDILANNPHLDVICPDIRFFGDSDHYWAAGGFVPGLLNHNTVFFSSVVRRSLWMKLGGYDDKIPHSILEDWDFWVRAYKINARCFRIPAPLFLHRSHPKQISRTRSQRHAGAIGMYLQNKWAKL